MKRRDYIVRYCIGVFFVVFIFASCATIPELTVNYGLPPKADELKGKKIFLSLVDNRAVRDILGEGARKEFKNFSGNISLSLARGKEEGFKVGLYDLSSLFMEVFTRRLQNLGAEVVPERNQADVEVAIVLKEFLLDLIDRKWTVSVGYEARLVKNKKVLAKQTITSRGERVKLVGRRQADTVLSEVFTEMINKLDVKKLLEQGNQ
jgi:hypothetical protein